MNKVIVILTILCGLKAAGLTFQVDNHGFILNWVTFTPMFSNNAGKDYKADSKYVNKYYIFAGYYNKLKEGKMKIQLKGMGDKSKDQKIEGILSFDKEQAGKLTFSEFSLNTMCKWGQPINIDNLDATVEGDNFVMTFNVLCTVPNVAEIAAQNVNGAIAGQIGGVAGEILGNAAGDAASDAVNKGLGELNKIFL